MKLPGVLILTGLLVTVPFPVAGNGSAGENPAATAAGTLIVRQLPEFRISKGEILYSRYCAFCHGETGAGDGLNAFRILVKPLSFANKEIMAQKADAELEKVILLGGASQGLSGYMPAFGHTFSDREAGYLIKYIRTAF